MASPSRAAQYPDTGELMRLQIMDVPAAAGYDFALIVDQAGGASEAVRDVLRAFGESINARSTLITGETIELA